MDGRKFDDLARAFASSTNRRRFLRRGTVAVAAAGGLSRVVPTEAARRGYSGKTALCKPDGGGGYARVLVSNVLLDAYLDSGYLLDYGCCADTDCSGSDNCSTSTCDLTTGACQSIPLPNDTPCTPGGNADLCLGPYTCQGGVCSEGPGIFCPSFPGPCIQFQGCNRATGQCETILTPDGLPCPRSGCADGTCSSGTCVDPPALSCSSNLCQVCVYNSCFVECNCADLPCLATNPECQEAHCNPDVGCIITNIDGLPCSGSTGMCQNGLCVPI